MTYNSPLTILAGIPQPTNYQPLSAIEDAKINIDEGQGNKEFSVWELLAIHIDNKLKLPEQIREVLLQIINPQVSLNNRVELPFTTSSNTIAIEVYWGNKRLVFFDDPLVNDLFRCVEIPYDSTDPEQYITPKIQN